MAKSEPGPPTIVTAIDEYLAVRRGELNKSDMATCEDALALLRDSLNGYAYQWLDGGELALWDAKFADGAEDAFCQLFGPEKVIDNLDQFFGDFMIRKVAADSGFLELAATTVGDLAGWLGERGYVDARLAERGTRRAGIAAHDLPRAARLADILYDVAQANAAGDGGMGASREYVEDYLKIRKVGPDALWFKGGIGPVPVPPEAAQLAEVGWSVNLVLARSGDGWQVMEVGNVYTE